MKLFTRKIKKQESNEPAHDLKSKTQEKGLTLIEIIVGIGLFSIFLIAMGSQLALVFRAQKQTLQEVRTIDSSRFAMESMTRTIRTISSADILTPVSNGTVTEIRFNHQGRVGGLGCPPPGPCEIRLRLLSGVLYERSGLVELPLTSPNIIYVEDFKAIVSGRGVEAPPQQPRITLVLSVRDVKAPAGTRLLPLATTITLRAVEL